ncbi:hypothetical protein FHC51_15300 [Leclercia sp. EC_58]|uniref:hypothetical protein n=1 Tax=Leclercia sp. EC_58 TaxID=2584090 RepID=UPI001C700AEC|nr:hypothetical protein [Leclercia sp. EC_58]MBW9401164.1 hypothetical protein [Leclercia sp. EC_58]
MRHNCAAEVAHKGQRFDRLAGGVNQKTAVKGGIVEGRCPQYCPSHAVVFAAKTNRFNMRSARQKSQTAENKKTDRFKMPCLLSKAAPGLAKPVAGGAPAASSLTNKGPALHAPGPLKSKKSGEARGYALQRR